MAFKTEEFQRHWEKHFEQSDPQLGNDVGTLIREHQEMRELLMKVLNFGLAVDCSPPHLTDIYLRTRANDLDRLKAQIDEVINPPPPIELNMFFDNARLKIDVWLTRGEEIRTLKPGRDFHLGWGTGRVEVGADFDHLWERIGGE